MTVANEFALKVVLIYDIANLMTRNLSDLRPDSPQLSGWKSLAAQR